MQAISLLCFCFICNLCFFFTPTNAIPRATVGVVLDFDSTVGKVAKTAIELAAGDVNNHPKLLSDTNLILHMHNSSAEDAIAGASAVLDVLKREVVAIIGQQAYEVAKFVARLGDAAKVPILSFSTTDPLLWMHRYPYFIRMAHTSSLQMEAIAAVVRAYGWRRIVVIYPNDDFGTGPLSSLSDALANAGSEIEYRSAIPPNADARTIREELYNLMTMQSRVFIAHVQPQLGSNLFMEAQKLGMMDAGYVWITTDLVTSLLEVLNASTLATMQGVLGVKSYIQNSTMLDAFTARWRKQFRIDNPTEEYAELNQFGLFAYDSVWVIAQAIDNLLRSKPRLRSFNFTDYVPSASGYGTELTGNLKVFREGASLLEELLRTNFSGLSCPMQLHDGEISGPTFEIVNVNGKNSSVIGYWTHGLGLKNVGASSSLAGPPSGVIWPGGSKRVPPGWVPAGNGKKIKIGVPLKHGFYQFVKVSIDSRRNETSVTGFCIDVFEAVLDTVRKELAYELEYEFIPYRPGHNDATQSYDNHVYQVYLKNLDAVVGDTTILAKRLNYVDFTQPFTDSGLVMVVPIKVDESNDAWAFLKPFTAGMWCTTAAFFVFTGVVVWLLEHKLNPQFRGTPKSQVVTLLWFAFSTAFFSQTERVVSGLGRTVMVIWLFVVLILTSSYTASLTSILTVQQMKASIQDVDSLRSNGVAVGYQEGSFVKEYLEKQLGIRNLKPYSTPEEYAEALSKGPNNGGVAAIFDEIPYIRLFLSTHCGYTIVGPTYRTGGFGFVFRKGSPLASVISNAVLALSERSKDMGGIEAKWFNNTACNNPGVASNRLSMKSFWGLYLITGMTSIIALIIFIGRLCYDFCRDPNAEREMLTIMKNFAKFADRKVPSPANSQWNGEGINNINIPTNASPSSFSVTTPYSTTFSFHGANDDADEVSARPCFPRCDEIQADSD